MGHNKKQPQDGLIDDVVAKVCDIHVQTERFRKDHIGPDFRSGTGWLLLVALYHARTLSKRRTVTQVSSDAGLAYPTAIRWLGIMEKMRLIVRETDVVDARRVWLDLTRDGVSKIEACLRAEAHLYQQLFTDRPEV